MFKELGFFNMTIKQIKQDDEFQIYIERKDITKFAMINQLTNKYILVGLLI